MGDRVAQLEGVLRELLEAVEREVRECAEDYKAFPLDPCTTCRDLLRPWAERARAALGDS
jgi:hypothetical protein